MNVLCDPDDGTLESMRSTDNVEWKLVLSGYWSNSLHHSGHIAYYLAKIGAQEWVLDGVERNAILDDVTQEDVDEGRLNDDQLQAMWGMTLEDAQEQEFRTIVAACKNTPPDTLPVDLASILYEAVRNAGGKVIEEPDRSDGLLKG